MTLFQMLLEGHHSLPPGVAEGSCSKKPFVGLSNYCIKIVWIFLFQFYLHRSSYLLSRLSRKNHLLVREILISGTLMLAILCSGKVTLSIWKEDARLLEASKASIDRS